MLGRELGDPRSIRPVRWIRQLNKAVDSRLGQPGERRVQLVRVPPLGDLNLYSQRVTRPLEFLQKTRGEGKRRISKHCDPFHTRDYGLQKLQSLRAQLAKNRGQSSDVPARR